jgi:hypothetical protein
MHMSDLQFDEGKVGSGSFQSRTILGAPETPGMVKMLVKSGIIKNESSGGKVLLLVAAISLILAVIIFSYFVLGVGHKSATRPDMNPFELNPPQPIE